MSTAIQTESAAPASDGLRVSMTARRRSCDEPPPSTLLRQIADHQVYGADGKAVPFGSLYSDRRCMIIFVRHFFCGICQDYLRNLVASISAESLDSCVAPTSIVLIGCGQPGLIADYVSRTSCPFPIFADPSRKLYEALGMITSLDTGRKRPAYQTTTFANIVGKSLMQAIGSGTNMLKGGDFSQVGGEFLFEDNQVTWCHRMRNTRDHTEINDLKHILRL